MKNNKTRIHPAETYVANAVNRCIWRKYGMFGLLYVSNYFIPMLLHRVWFYIPARYDKIFKASTFAGVSTGLHYAILVITYCQWYIRLGRQRLIEFRTFREALDALNSKQNGS
jgi:hypothetical protein